MGVNLVAYASERRVGMEAREEEDKINDFGRDPIGEGLEERVRLYSGRQYCFIDIDSTLVSSLDRNIIASSRGFLIMQETMQD